MGQEAKTTLRWDGRILEGTALLETDSLIFRGAASLTIKFSEIFKADANGGFLDLQTSRGLLMLELGPKAEGWAEKIKNPKALVEKLGLDATKKVAIVGKLDPGLKAEIAGSGAKVAKSARGKDFDVVFLAAAKKADLDKFPVARALIKDEGAIWVVYPKGVEVVRERDVLIAGRSLPMTDNKVAKVDDVLTATKFVVPTHARKKK